MNRILIPLDGSEFSSKVLEVVRQFFAPGAHELVLYQVGAPTEGFVGLPPRPATPELPVPVYSTAEDLEQARHPIYDTQEQDSRLSAITDALDEIAAPLRNAGYTVTVEADLGHPAEAIIERTRADDIHLVAMTTHGRSGVSRLLFGSVAEQVVRHTAAPVLLVRPGERPEA